MSTIKLDVTGMTCHHCVMHVKEELQELDGIDSVSVDLQPGGTSTVEVTTTGDVSDDALREAVDDAGGYEVAEIAR